jgi:tetratricopeptide (TPR) repeat protein
MHSILALSSFYHDDDEGLHDATRALDLAREHNIPRLLLRAYHRRVFCYALRGRLHTEEASRVTEAALAWAAQSGDLRSKAIIYNTVGCYHLDTGDLDKAERFFREAETIVCGPSERALVFGNLGELSYCKGAIQTAEVYYRKAAAEAESQPVMGFISIGVLAGLGLCALESGKLAAAQAAESRVRQALSGTWVHDPYLIVRFLAELDRRRGHIREAVQLLHDRAKLEERRPIYWIRTKALEARYLRLIDPDAAEELWVVLRERTQDLGLPQMLRR